MTQQKKVFVHIGLPKTGTTYLQGVLANNREVLADQGILYPGSGQAHFLAAQDLAEHQFLGQDNPKVDGSWNALAKEANQWRGDVLISHELFTVAQDQHIARLMRDLSGSEIHVVATARDLERQIPAVWQERLKNGAKVSFNRHFEQVEQHSHSAELEGFWRQQNLPRIIDRWLRVLPKEQIHVVTVPQPGAPRDQLWQRFASVVGINSQSVDIDAPVAGNLSLSPEQARFLRRINAAQQIPRALYLAVVKRYLTQKAAVRLEGGQPHGLTVAQRRIAGQWSREMVEHVRATGVLVEGDLGDIYPVPEPSTTPAPLDRVEPRREAEVATRMTAALIQWMVEQDQANDESEAGSQRLRRRLRNIGGRARLGR